MATMKGSLVLYRMLQIKQGDCVSAVTGTSACLLSVCWDNVERRTKTHSHAFLPGIRRLLFLRGKRLKMPSQQQDEDATLSHPHHSHVIHLHLLLILAFVSGFFLVF